jgi:PAS domain S-box-containing protein
MVVLKEKKERTEAELLSLLGSVNDIIQMVDKNGLVTYVNKAFEGATGISAQDVVGQNIYEKQADNPLVHALQTKQKITGQKYSFHSTGREFNYSVTPVIVSGEVVGAIGIFKAYPDILKLMEELQRSTTIIEGLYERLGQINGLAELNISDVMPIDKMEQILLRQALTKYGYSVEGKKKASRALNISLATLYNKLKKYQIS